MKEKEKKGEKGSMTVEAVIALPVFLLLFMTMMYLVNVCNAYLALNHAVDQTAKYTANSVYVYAKISEKLDTSGEWEEINAKKESLMSDTIESLMSGGSLADGYGPVKALADRFVRTKLKDLLGGMVIGAAEASFENMSEGFLLDMIDGTKVDKSRVSLTLYKLPKDDLRGDNALGYEYIFGEDDIVVQAQYDMRVELPLMSTFDFPIVSTCVEKGFVKGGNEEYIDFEDESFFTRLGL